jgi:hypothetical protein
MSRTLQIFGEVHPNHTITVSVPTDVPVGPALVTVTVEDDPASSIQTFGDLLRSGFVGSLPEDSELPRTGEEFAAWRKKLWERGTD